MNENAAVAVFEMERDRLFGLAYRMTSSVMDADDIVQETWVRFARAVEAGESIENPAAFLTTVASRLAIDRLRSAARRRETYVGPWLPEPILTDRDPAHLVELDESIRLGFLRVLDRLGPVDRAVFLLHDVFGQSFAEVATVVDRTEANCRQIARRARARIREERREVVAPAPPSDEELLEALLLAAASGDPAQLEAKLAADVVLLSDAGAEVRAARNAVTGRYRLARFIIGVNKKAGAEVWWEKAWVNGGIAVAVVDENGLDQLWEIEFVDGLVQNVHACMNPSKVAAARTAWPATPLRPNPDLPKPEV